MVLITGTTSATDSAGYLDRSALAKHQPGSRIELTQSQYLSVSTTWID